MAILKMTGVTKEYPLGKTTVHALRGVDFAVEEGELLPIIGPSGSGKTTLLNLIGCIDAPSAGSIEVHGTLLEISGISLAPIPGHVFTKAYLENLSR